ncbi:conserved hypothetical protein [Mesorhizobium ventifaucium]|uniref:DUF4287 domain-containing protein n=1 Tax=Mesorhizobium ventifaucium TaxID=666020 RepID=A0ABM9DRR4_9HYPH|nr:conserved hypothetical protein [Mesorhizobium ventifaucium]
MGLARAEKMVRAISTKNFEAETGRSWEEWLVFLGRIGAADLSHAEIARRVRETGLASGWWSQSITVAYEQHIGRRIPGQDNDGRFAVSTTKTVPGSMDETLARWATFMTAQKDIGGIAISRGPETSVSRKWRYWRCGLANGTRVIAGIGDKPGGKSSLAVQHEKLATADDVECWRNYWKSLLNKF